MDRKILFALGAAGLVAAVVILKRIAPPEEGTETPKANPISISAADREKAEREFIQKMAPQDAAELLNIKPDDTVALKKAYKDKLGVDMKELRKNSDGSYDIVLVGGEKVKLGESPMGDSVAQEKFRDAFLKAANKGRSTNLDSRDQEAIRRFRASLGSK